MLILFVSLLAIVGAYCFNASLLCFLLRNLWVFFFSFRCRNCGSVEHRHWECPEQKNITNNVLCTRCGGAGHLASDCIQTEYVLILT